MGLQKCWGCGFSIHIRIMVSTQKVSLFSPPHSYILLHFCNFLAFSILFCRSIIFLPLFISEYPHLFEKCRGRGLSHQATPHPFKYIVCCSCIKMSFTINILTAVLRVRSLHYNITLRLQAILQLNNM